jgi:GNAT superfamily N-acetyltransferase
MNWSPRIALDTDIRAIEELIPVSVRVLQAPYYSSAQMEAALGTVFAVDRQLIRDRTYYVVEDAGRLAGCGGWSKRKSLYGGDHHRTAEDGELDPQHDAARVRAFFVHPAYARQGIGRSIINACEAAIATARFRRIELVATLAGEPLYAAAGYSAIERNDITLVNGAGLPVVRMGKTISPGRKT